MFIENKKLAAVLAAVITGLPQGINAKPLATMSPIISPMTIYIVIAFGLIGGGIMAISLMKERINKSFFLSNYIDLYTYFMVSLFCVGIPIFIQNTGVNLQDKILFLGYFFTATGSGIVVGGAISHASKKT